MSEPFATIYVIYLLFSIALDVAANILIKLSRGFKIKHYAVLAIVFALASFTFFSFAIKAIPLSAAYGIWGGVGLIATALAGILLFKEKIKPKGWLGILLIIIGVVLMRLTLS